MGDPVAENRAKARYGFVGFKAPTTEPGEPPLTAAEALAMDVSGGSRRSSDRSDRSDRSDQGERVRLITWKQKMNTVNVQVPIMSRFKMARPPVPWITKRTAILRLLDQGGSTRVPAPLAQAMISYGWDRGAWGLGLLTLHIAVANWGISDYLDDASKHLANADDPAGLDWAGPRPHGGKRYHDGGTRAPYGGLGICHADSGLLEDICEYWGYPPGGQRWGDKDNDDDQDDHFNRIIRGPHRDAWFKWADSLLQTKEFHIWLVDNWTREYWAPAWSVYSKQRSWTEGERVVAAAMNARIGNSAKSWARGLRDRAACFEEQAESYIAKKEKSRGERGAARAKRQVLQVRRVAVVVEALKIEVL